MKVSIIVAAYNVEDYIDRCMNSLVHQTFKDIEIIVVNDGSTDETKNKIKKYMKVDKRINLISQLNKGAIEARKTGLEYATGEYIWFVDGDDWVEDHAVEILYNNAKINNADIVLFNAFKARSYEDKEVYITHQYSEKYPLEEFLLGKIIPALWAKFIRLDFFKSNNILFPQDISFAEDLATSAALFTFEPKVSLVDTPLYNYYIRNNSITNSINSNVLDVPKAFNHIESILLEYNLYIKYKNLFEYCAFHHIFLLWCLRYAAVESKYSKELYQCYKKLNIDIYSNLYIQDKLQEYPLRSRLRIRTYDYSYNLGQLYDRFRAIFKRS